MVLRMLFIKDLRKLQTQIDEMIVQVQVSTTHRHLGHTSSITDMSQPAHIDDTPIFTGSVKFVGLARRSESI